MSKEQQLSKLAEQGLITKENIIKAIKYDYFNKYNTYDSLDKLYSYLARKYDKSKRTIMRICLN